MDTTKQLYWAKSTFSLNYDIYENGMVVGFIKDSSLSRSMKASIFGNNYIFEASGFLKPHISVIDMEQKKELGKVTFSLLRQRAEIHLFGQSYLWKFHNYMSSKWKLFNRNKEVLISSDNRKEGFCTISDAHMPLLLLVSLTIRNHFWKQEGH